MLFSFCVWGNTLFRTIAGLLYLFGFNFNQYNPKMDDKAWFFVSYKLLGVVSSEPIKRQCQVLRGPWSVFQTFCLISSNTSFGVTEEFRIEQEGRKGTPKYSLQSRQCIRNGGDVLSPLYTWIFCLELYTLYSFYQDLLCWLFIMMQKVSKYLFPLSPLV